MKISIVQCAWSRFKTLVIFCLLISYNSLACDLSNESPWFWNEDRLIKDTPNIFLVKIKSYNKQNMGLETEYNAEILEIVKTNNSSQFKKGGEILLKKFAPPDTDTKAWEHGWSKKSGRAIHTKACEIWVPFSVGKSYLVFYGIFHSKAYEEIKNPLENPWYKLVKKSLKN